MRAGACSAGNLAGNGYTQRYGSFLHFFFFFFFYIGVNRFPPYSPTVLTHPLPHRHGKASAQDSAHPGRCMLDAGPQLGGVGRYSQGGHAVPGNITAISTINTTPTVSCTVIPCSFYDKANSLRLSLASSPKISSNKNNCGALIRSDIVCWQRDCSALKRLCTRPFIFAGLVFGKD